MLKNLWTEQGYFFFPPYPDSAGYKHITILIIFSFRPIVTNPGWQARKEKDKRETLEQVIST